MFLTVFPIKKFTGLLVVFKSLRTILDVSLSKVKLSNLPFAGKFHCSTCPNISSNCGLTYSLSHNGYITTSFENGYICMAYLKYAMDENGEYIIPDNEDLIRQKEIDTIKELNLLDTDFGYNVSPGGNYQTEEIRK